MAATPAQATAPLPPPSTPSPRRRRHHLARLHRTLSKHRPKPHGKKPAISQPPPDVDLDALQAQIRHCTAPLLRRPRLLRPVSPQGQRFAARARAGLVVCVPEEEAAPCAPSLADEYECWEAAALDGRMVRDGLWLRGAEGAGDGTALPGPGDGDGTLGGGSVG